MVEGLQDDNAYTHILGVVHARNSQVLLPNAYMESEDRRSCEPKDEHNVYACVPCKIYGIGMICTICSWYWENVNCKIQRRLTLLIGMICTVCSWFWEDVNCKVQRRLALSIQDMSGGLTFIIVVGLYEKATNVSHMQLKSKKVANLSKGKTFEKGKFNDFALEM